MPARKKKTAAKKTKSFEEALWDSANRLRATVESSEFKHVVMSLIFLKFVSDKFEERKAELEAEGQGALSTWWSFTLSRMCSICQRAPFGVIMISYLPDT